MAYTVSACMHHLILLLWCAQAVQAAQVVMEDYALSSIGLAPLQVFEIPFVLASGHLLVAKRVMLTNVVHIMQVVGYEGVLGVIALAILLTIVQFLPGKDGEGIHEDTIESFHMVSHVAADSCLKVVMLQ